MLRVVAADNDVSVRMLLSVLIGSDNEYEFLGGAADGVDAIRLATELHPDVMILDVMMPVMNGLDAMPKIRAASPTTKIVLYSSLEPDSLGPAAAEADGFVVKGSDAIDRLVEELDRFAGVAA